MKLIILALFALPAMAELDYTTGCNESLHTNCNVDIDNTTEYSAPSKVAAGGGQIEFHASSASFCKLVTNNGAADVFVPLRNPEERIINGGGTTNVVFADCTGGGGSQTWQTVYGCNTAALMGPITGMAGTDCSSEPLNTIMYEGGACSSSQLCVGVGNPNAECYEMVQCLAF